MDYNFTIIRRAPRKFVHLHNGLVDTKFSISKWNCSIDGIKFKIVENDGASRYPYLIPNITIIDEFTGGLPETYATLEEFEDRLRELEYPPYVEDSQLVETVILRKGDVIEIDVDHAYVLANFDQSNGLGINERVGWVIQGWYPGTLASKGRVSVQWNPADALFATLGQPGGSKTATLIKDNLPPFENWTPSSLGGDANYAPAGPPFSLRKEEIGASLPFSILQPFVVVLKIQRTTDLIVYGNGSVVTIGDVVSAGTGVTITGTGTQVDPKVINANERPIKEISGASYTFILSDNTKNLLLINGSAQTLTLNNAIAFPIGTVLMAKNFNNVISTLVAAASTVYSVYGIALTSVNIPAGFTLILTKISADWWSVNFYTIPRPNGTFANDAAALIEGVAIGSEYVDDGGFVKQRLI